MSTATCIECDGVITLTDGLVKSEILQCPDCGVELEVMDIDPVKLEAAPQEEEDWGE